MILLLSILFPADSLLNRYQNSAQKAVKKSLSVDDYSLIQKEFHGGELYTIQSKDQAIGYLLLSEVAACNLGGCPSYKTVEQDVSSEYFDLMTVLDKDSKILSIKILDYFSDYGYEITSKKYLKKFYGYTACDINQDKDEVDAISGATISSYALEGKLGQLCKYL